LIRAIGVLMIVLGVLFWTGNALTLISIHMLLGILLVLLVWAQAFMAARSGVHLGVVALAVVWGLIVPVLGMTQDSLLVGPLHWLIQVLHLFVGLALIGIAETLARRASAYLAGARAAGVSPA
jgi:hypothetical protein